MKDVKEHTLKFSNSVNRTIGFFHPLELPDQQISNWILPPELFFTISLSSRQSVVIACPIGNQTPLEN